MRTVKFDENDRRKVIRTVENAFNTKLSRVETRRKELRDNSGTLYWVFGGYQAWHGIPQDMMRRAEQNKDGILVIAQRGQNKIRIFWGKLYPLVENKKNLAHTQKEDFQFHISITGRHMFIKEVPILVLTELDYMLPTMACADSRSSGEQRLTP